MELKCEKCGNTGLTLLSSKIEGLDRVIDIYFCKKCQQSKIVSTAKDSKNTETEVINVPAPDVETPEYEEDSELSLDQPENPYVDDDGGWDPNIG
jgi:hypothetical protein